MNNNTDMNQVAQKLLNKLALQEYNNSILETQVETLQQQNQQNIQTSHMQVQTVPVL